MPYHERADPRFVWNGQLLRELTNQPELCRFCLPLLHGCILHASKEHYMLKRNDKDTTPSPIIVGAV